MPRAKRGPGAAQEDPPSKRGERATTRRSSGSDEMAPAANEGDPVLRDALGLPPRLPDSTANTTMVGTAGDDEDGHWRNNFEPEEHRRPRVTDPSTPLQTGNEEVDFGVALTFCENLTVMRFRGTVGRILPWKGFPGRSRGQRCAPQRKSTLSPVRIVSS